VNAIVDEVALTLMRSELSGFDGYPTSELGEKRFAREFQNVCVSVDHLRALLAYFDTHFPTVREIRDTAENIKDRFLPKQDLRAEWEKQYGPAQRFSLKTEGICLHCHRPWAEIIAGAHGKRRETSPAGLITNADIEKAVRELHSQAHEVSPDADSDAA